MKLTLAYDYDDEAGKSHKAETTADFPDVEARRLLREGNARPADSASRKAAATAVPNDSAQDTTPSRQARQTTEKKG